MSNPCDTTIQFRGDENALMDLFNRLKPESLSKIAQSFGISREETSAVTCDYSPFRGDVVDIDKSSYRVYQDDAWWPHVSLWTVICHKIYDDKISFVYKAEESGCDVYINTDDSGLFFPEKIMCDYAVNGESDVMYFCEEKEFLDWFNNKFGYNAKTVAAAKAFAENDELCMSIGEFSPIL